jgi:hypothetical protein
MELIGRGVNVITKPKGDIEWEGVFLGWGTCDGDTVAIIEDGNGAVELVSVYCFEFVSPTLPENYL